ncbi:hypothetical protein QG37_04044 [Candidozyma auris]|nr:hypothetical protein QG37_04044 [[Candida] auris]
MAGLISHSTVACHEGCSGLSLSSGVMDLIPLNTPSCNLATAPATASDTAASEASFMKDDGKQGEGKWKLWEFFPNL